MKEQVRRCGLLVLAMMPIASVSFAAKSALSIGQLRKPGVTAAQLAASTADSTVHGSGH